MLASSRAGFYKSNYKELPPAPNTFVLYTSFNSPYIHAHEWRDNAGFGPKYADPANVATLSAARQCDVSPNSNVVIVGGDASPYIAAYEFNVQGTGFGNRYANPSVLPNGQCYALRFNRAGNAIAYGQVPGGSTKSIFVYRWNDSTGFGTKYTDLAASPSQAVTDIDFSRNDDAIAMTFGATPYVRAFAWDNTTGFGSVRSGPSTLPPGACFSVKFNTANNCVAVGTQLSPYIHVYAWTSAGFGTKFTNSGTLPTSVVQDLDFAPDDGSLVVGFASSPYIAAYKWNNSTGFGVRWNNPTSLPPAPITGIKISPSSRQVVYAASNGGTGGYMFDPTLVSPSTPALTQALTSPPGVGAVEDITFGKRQ